MPRTTLSPLAALAALALFAACAEPTAVPAVQRDVQARAAKFNPPPPPPIDTQSVAYDEEAADSPFTILSVTYFQNEPATSSWIAFEGEGASPGARIHLLGDGSVRGTGTLAIGDELFALADAALVPGSSTLNSCTVQGDDRIPDRTTGSPFALLGSCGGVSLMFGERVIRFQVGYTTEEAERIADVGGEVVVP